MDQSYPHYPFGGKFSKKVYEVIGIIYKDETEVRGKFTFLEMNVACLQRLVPGNCI